MKKTSIIIMILAFVGIILSSADKANAQADTLLNFCASHITSSYISDGQVYQTPISKEETAEFNVTFYGGSTYRVAACGGLDDGNIIFTIYDRDRNELFSSSDYSSTPYWDFKFTSTVDCLIEAKLNEKKQDLESAFAILLIGFKN